ncbi:MAG: hypothetical protein CM1200mP12_21780 [Gammaproteobacteria bacterium]|nr:MAG: hypothetical protein CM1200mP12_21780 [Gammaproteobacteria bacterium]
MRIFIVGPMASGKSILGGKKLAQTLNIDFIDTDKEIEKKAGAEISGYLKLKEKRVLEKEKEKFLTNLLNKEDLLYQQAGELLR